MPRPRGRRGRPLLSPAVRLALTAFVFAAALVPLGCRRDAHSAIAWRDLADGLQYAIVHTQGSQSQALVTVHVLRFQPQKWQQRVVGPQEVGRPTADAAEFREAVGAIAAINAGYFDRKLRPLGLLVSEGKERSRLRKVDHGVWTVTQDGTVGLQHARQFLAPAGLDFAIECGPRLVVDGKALTFKPGIARRTAVGHDVEGRAYWVATSGVVSLPDFSAFLAKRRAAGGVGLHAALNLDGGSSTMFDLDVAETVAAVRSSVQVPVGLALVRRPQQP